MVKNDVKMEMKEMKMKVNEHYVPKFYLKQFVGKDNKLAVYDAKLRKQFPAFPRDICFEKYLYETPLKNDNSTLGKYILPNDIENIFNKYETSYSALLTSIKTRCSDYSNGQTLILSTIEKQVLLKMVVNFLVRNPAFFDALSLNNPDPEIKKSAMVYLQNVFKDMGFDFSEEICLAAHKKAILTNEFAGSLPDVMVKHLDRLDFSFYYAEIGEFISSDTPVCVGEDQESTSEDKLVVYLPLTPKIAVVFGNYRNSRAIRNRSITVQKNTIDRFNIEIVRGKRYQRFVFASKKNVLQQYIEA